MAKSNQIIPPEEDPGKNKTGLVKAPTVNINKRTMPDIEGITIPVAGNSAPSHPLIQTQLTGAEKLLIESTPVPKKSTPAGDFKPSAPRITLPPRKSQFLKWVLICIFMAILGAAGYLAYEKFYLGTRAQQKTSPDGQAAVVPTTTASPTDQASPTAEPTATPIPAVTVPAKTQLKINSTPTGYLNVRQSPSSAAAMVTKVHPGETYTYDATKNGWYQITLQDGSSGWVSGQYVTKQ